MAGRKMHTDTHRWRKRLALLQRVVLLLQCHLRMESDT